MFCMARHADFEARFPNGLSWPYRPSGPGPARPAMTDPEKVRHLLEARIGGREGCGRPVSEELLPLVYDELKSLAARRMAGEAPGQTLQATALVHEAWLSLAKAPSRQWNDRAHFFRAAALAMRRILVGRARAKARLKRGEGLPPVNLDAVEIADETEEDRILQVDEMLDRLETEDPDSARIVTLKFFGGLTNGEIAAMDDVTERTVERKWAYARGRLYQMIRQEPG